MENQRIIAVDQSTSSTKALLFDQTGRLLSRASADHSQYYPQAGWAEHDAEEIYANTVKAIREAVSQTGREAGAVYSLALTNQRETIVVWEKATGRPVHRALVWQDTRTAGLCRRLREAGRETLVSELTGLRIDPNFPATGIAWLLDHVDGARRRAEAGELLAGTIECWLIWKLTGGQLHATDVTNASRTMLLNIHTLQWDDRLLSLFGVPRQMLPEVRPTDARYGRTTVEGLFPEGIEIAGVLGDSHAALAGQLCFRSGTGKATYGTGSSVMVNIGREPLPAPEGLVTSVAFSAWGETYFGYEGNIYSTGATVKWLSDQLGLLSSPRNLESECAAAPDSGGVYLVPAFAGLGAPWWSTTARAALVGMTFATTRAHVLRAALESIALQVADLVEAMTRATSQPMSEICADGGPTANATLMQLQADLVGADLVTTEVDDASAFGAFVMNGMARGLWTSYDQLLPLRKEKARIAPDKAAATRVARLQDGWRKAVKGVIAIQ